jgi:serine/threonine protein kinase
LRDHALDRAAPEIRHPLGISRFELIRCLGAGATGTVFEALDLSTGAHVALKVLREHTGLALLRFKHEFRVLAELTHPNLVRFGGLFEEHGQFYLTMELVEGQEFLDFVRPAPRSGWEHGEPTRSRARAAERRAPIISGGVPILPLHAGWRGQQDHPGELQLGRLRTGLVQLASALMALHAAGLVHRDVKPQNILVTNSGRLVLLDFGLALNVEEEHSREIAGTMAYMAPEQALGQDVHGAADWYAMGVLLYEALTGRLPPTHQRFRNLWAEAKDRAPLPADSHPGLPDDLNALCSGLLEFSPERRLDENDIARRLGMEVDVERGRAGFRSQVQFASNIFVARERELELLRGALARAEAGAFPVVSIEGESGIGKSALVRQLISQLRRAGQVVVLASRCYDSETMPYRGVDGVVDALVRHLTTLGMDGELLPVPEHADFLTEVFPVFRALPGLESCSRPEQFDVDPQEARQKAFHAFKQMFRFAAANTPTLVHVDDAQWLDADGIALLASLTRERDVQALLVLALRPPRQSRLHALLTQSADHEHIVLGPLSGEHSEALVRLMLEGRSVRNDVDPAALARTSGGHPLFIQELVVHARRTHKPVATLDEAVNDRLVALDERARTLLHLVALAAGPLNNLVARSASGLSPELFPWVLSELRSQNLISFNSDSMAASVQTNHDRIRDLIVEQMDGAARRLAHRGLAEALEAHAPEELEALAQHFAAAGQAAPAARYAALAGQRALERLTFERAATLYQLALRLEARGVIRAQLESGLGHALAGAGRGRSASAAYLRAADGERGLAALELRRRASEQLLSSGHVEQGCAILFSVLREVGMFVPHTDVAALLCLVKTLLELCWRGLRLRAAPAPLGERQQLALRACWSAATGLSIVHHLRATDFQARALMLALDAGDLDRAVKAAALLSTTLGNADGPARGMAERLRARARELAGNAPSDEHAAWLDLTTGVSRMSEWDFRGCEALCSRAAERFRTRCSGAAWETGTSQAFALWSAMLRGDLSGVARRLPELLAEARARGDRHAETALVLSPLHLLGLAADRPDEVRSQCARSMAEWPSKLACFQHMCGAYVLAHADLYQARAESAWQHVAYAWKMLKSAHLARVQFQRIDLLGLRGRTALAQAAATRGRRRACWLRQAEGDAGRLRGERAPAALAIADLIGGGVEHLRGEQAQSRASLERARLGFEGLAMQLHARVSHLARDLLDGDREAAHPARLALTQLGVANPAGMLRLWVPGVLDDESAAG